MIDSPPAILRSNSLCNSLPEYPKRKTLMKSIIIVIGQNALESILSTLLQ